MLGMFKDKELMSETKMISRLHHVQVGSRSLKQLLLQRGLLDLFDCCPEVSLRKARLFDRISKH